MMVILAYYASDLGIVLLLYVSGSTLMDGTFCLLARIVPSACSLSSRSNKVESFLKDTFLGEPKNSD
jgi:hypothetical protein